MKLPKELTTVTPLSRRLALVLFILLPIVGFLFGEKYQATIDSTISQSSLQPSQQKTNLPPTVTQFIDPTWQKVSIEIKNNNYPGAQKVPKGAHLIARIPPSWKLNLIKNDIRPNNPSTNCSTYSISDPTQSDILQLQLICDGGRATDSDIPSGSIIVTQFKSPPSGGGLLESRIRVPQKDNIFSYFTGLIWKDAVKGYQNKIGNILEIGYSDTSSNDFSQWVNLKLTYKGNSNVKDIYLKTADQIVASLFLE